MAADKDDTMESPWPCYPVAPPPRGEDLPYSDGVPMESERHFKQMMLLAETLESGWRHRDDFYVGRNMFLYYSELQSKKNDFRGPDVFVVLDTVRKERKSWVVWEEDGRTPDVVIEITSPATEGVDRGEKMRIYAQILHVGEYYLFDPFEARLEGYVLDSGRRTYRPMEPDERGFLRSAMLGLWLGTVKGTNHDVEADWLRWIDHEGHALPTGEERARVEAGRAMVEAERAQVEAERAQVEAERAQVEAERADRAEHRLRQAADKLLASGMEPHEVAEVLGIEPSAMKA
jgi:Uma2 family endonuclease